MKMKLSGILGFVLSLILSLAFVSSAQDKASAEAYSGTAIGTGGASAARPSSLIFASRSTRPMKRSRTSLNSLRTRAPTVFAARSKKKTRAASTLSAPPAIRSRSRANARKALTPSSPSLPLALCLSWSYTTVDAPLTTLSVIFR